MSDQTSKAGDGVHEDHWCEHPNCKKWGGFGYFRSKAGKSSWHCWEHYPQQNMFKGNVLTPSVQLGSADPRVAEQSVGK